MSKIRQRIVYSCLVILIMLSGMTSQASTNLFPNLENVNWLVLGPLDNPSNLQAGVDCQGFDHDYLTSIGGEAKARPRLNQKINQHHWESYHSYYGGLDFIQIFGSIENSVAYAYLEFKSATAQTAVLKLGSDDGVKLWFNGDLVWNHHIHRSLNTDDEAITLRLVSGLNRLLLKVDQGSGGWGFEVRLTTLAQENHDWKLTHQRGLKFISSSLKLPILAQSARISGTVTTVPSFAVREPVILLIQDLQGKTLARQSTLTGEPVFIDLPKGFTGICKVTAIGFGSIAKLKSEPVTILVGNLKKSIFDAVTRARQIVKKIPFEKNREDIAATLTFLADQLEGKVHPSLVNYTRNIRAIQTIHELCQNAETILAQSFTKKDTPPLWSAGTFKGLRQWAYRSEVDGTCQPYTLYLPKDYNPLKKYSLVLCLHGYSGDDYGAASNLAILEPKDFIIAAPLGRGDIAYRSIGEQDVLDLMELLQQNYSVDSNRIYLVGWSMGGCGTWRISQLFTDHFAAIAPFCGWTSLDYLENLRNLPILIVHGDADPTVPIAMDQAAAEELSELNYPVRFDKLSGVNHDAWSAWIKGEDGNRLLEYFRKYQRNPWPQKVNLKVTHLRYGKQYWVKVFELEEPLMMGSIQAEVIDSRHLKVETNNVNVFALDLGHPLLAQKGRILLDLNGYALAVDAGQSQCILSYSPEQNKYIIHKARNLEIAPHEGGGLADLFMGPLYIVYGTARNREVLKQAAYQLADWSQNNRIPYGTKVGKLRVKADSGITKEEINKANLLLLGTTAENRLLANLAGKLPLFIKHDQVRIGKTKFTHAGLILTYPNPLASNHLLGVLSLPFNKDAVMNITSQLKFNLQAYGLGPDDIGSYILPDVMVLSSPETVKWQGEFNYQWGKLRKLD